MIDKMAPVIIPIIYPYSFAQMPVAVIQAFDRYKRRSSSMNIHQLVCIMNFEPKSKFRIIFEWETNGTGYNYIIYPHSFAQMSLSVSPKSLTKYKMWGTSCMNVHQLVCIVNFEPKVKFSIIIEWEITIVVISHTLSRLYSHKCQCQFPLDFDRYITRGVSFASVHLFVS